MMFATDNSESSENGDSDNFSADSLDVNKVKNNHQSPISSIIINKDGEKPEAQCLIASPNSKTSVHQILSDISVASGQWVCPPSTPTCDENRVAPRKDHGIIKEITEESDTNLENLSNNSTNSMNCEQKCLERSSPERSKYFPSSVVKVSSDNFVERVVKKKEQLKIPFYKGDVPISEVKKVQQLNKPASKKGSIHVLAEDEARKKTGPNKGVVERWRHKVWPIYENGLFEVANTCKDKCNRSCISDDIAKLSLNKNMRTRRMSRSLCSVDRSNQSSTKPLPSQKPPLPFGYFRQKKESYFEQYRVQKYGPIMAKRRPSPEGSECSQFEGSSVKSLRSDLQDKKESFSTSESSSSEHSFYRKVISGEFSPEDALKSVSQLEWAGPSEDSCPRRKNTYVPYSLEDYRSILEPTSLRKLGPDPDANKEKLERVKRQREYGDMASLRNIHRMKSRKTRKKHHSHSPPPNSLNVTSQMRETCSSLFQSQIESSTGLSVRSCAFTSVKPAVQSRTDSTSRQSRSPSKRSTVAKVTTRQRSQEEERSKKSLIKILQERHIREQEIAEGLRREHLT